MTSDNEEKYQRCVRDTIVLVQRWQRSFPTLRPFIGWPKQVALITALADALENDGVLLVAGGVEQTLNLQMNDAARVLARDILKSVPDVSWMIFRFAWEYVYGQQAQANEPPPN